MASQRKTASRVGRWPQIGAARRRGGRRLALATRGTAPHSDRGRWRPLTLSPHDGTVPAASTRFTLHGYRPAWGEAHMNEEETRCGLCQQPISEGQHQVAQADGRRAHVTCWAAEHQPSVRPTPDPICVTCSKPIRPTQSIIKSGVDLVHVNCFVAHEGPSTT